MQTMLKNLQELREEREEGFTLIELLVVILIIGILSAIAIPAFLNQRKSAVDSSVQSDLASVAKGIESWTVKQGATEKAIPLSTVSNTEGSTEFAGSEAITAELADIKVSDGTFVGVSGTSFGYCLEGTNAGGDLAASENGSFVYASLSGGLQKEEGTCDNGVFAAGNSASAPFESEASGDVVVGPEDKTLTGIAVVDDVETAYNYQMTVTRTSKADGTITVSGVITGATSGSLDLVENGAFEFSGVAIASDGTFSVSGTRNAPPGEYPDNLYVNGTLNGVYVFG